MKAHEAYEVIEQKAATLDLPAWLGEDLMPVEKISMASRFHGEKAQKLDESFRRGEITPEVYRDQWFELIDWYARHLVRIRMERLLTGEAS